MPAGRSATVTILFTDVVGSTARRARLGDQVADSLDIDHERTLGEVIAAAGGRVVKGLGDGIMAAFEGAADAIDAAIGLQLAVAVANARTAAERRTQIRVGLSTGDVTADGDDYRGTPVVEASRLCATAEPGEILCADLTRLMARSRTEARLGEPRPRTLKGIDEPVAACVVEWDAPDAASLSVPPTLRTRERFAFVGRAAELDGLERAWKRAEAAERPVVLIGGEPGQGKTRLAAEFARQVVSAGGLVLAGRCEEQLDVPYQPFMEALRDYVQRDPGAVELGDDAGELVRLWPGLSKVVPGLAEPVATDAETERYRVLDAVASWLSDVSRTAPVLLVLDDLHWATGPTMLLLRHLVRSSHQMRLMVLVTYRDTETTGEVAAVFADLRRDGAERLALTGLDGDGVAALMTVAAEQALDGRGQALATALYHETRGNPFFIGEVLTHLAESGAIYQSGGLWTTDLEPTDIPIPESVRDVVGRRLGRLSDAANEVLRFAAVIGRDFNLHVVGEASGDRDAALDYIEEAAAAGLVEEVGVAEYRFAHALVRETLYDLVPPTRRARMHHAIGEAIEAVYADPTDARLADLSRHFAAAVVPGDALRAVRYARLAGEAARARRAFEEAAVHFRRALDVGEAAPSALTREQRCEVMISYAEALRWSASDGAAAAEQAATALAIDIGNPQLLLQACELRSDTTSYTLLGEVNQERVALLRATLAALPIEDSRERSLALAALGVELAFAPDSVAAREEMSSEAVAMARRLGDDDALAFVLRRRYSTYWHPNGFEESSRVLRELNTLRAGTPAEESPAIWLEIQLIHGLESGDLAAARAAAEAIAARTSGTRLRHELHLTKRIQCLMADVGGRFEEAEAFAAESHELALNIRLDAFLNYVVQLYALRLQQGRLPEIVDLAVQYADELTNLPALAATLPYTLFACGRADEARVRYDAFAARDFELPMDPGWTAGTVMLARAVAAFRRADHASVLYARLEPLRDMAVATGLYYLGSVRHYLGVLAATLGDLASAEDHYVAAERWERSMEAPLWTAAAIVGRAETAMRRHDPAGARVLAEEAIRTAAPLGRSAVVERANALLH